jgi:hypothetical protein
MCPGAVASMPFNTGTPKRHSCRAASGRRSGPGTRGHARSDGRGSREDGLPRRHGPRRRRGLARGGRRGRRGGPGRPCRGGRVCRRGRRGGRARRGRRRGGGGRGIRWGLERRYTRGERPAHVGRRGGEGPGGCPGTAGARALWGRCRARGDLRPTRVAPDASVDAGRPTRDERHQGDHGQRTGSHREGLEDARGRCRSLLGPVSGGMAGHDDHSSALRSLQARE